MEDPKPLGALASRIDALIAADEAAERRRYEFHSEPARVDLDRWRFRAQAFREVLTMVRPAEQTEPPAVADQTPLTQVEPAELPIIWVDADDVPHVGTVNGLADHLDGASLTGGPGVTAVYVTRGGELIRAQWRVDGDGRYDADDFANSIVIVTAPDGMTASATWRIDGRA